MRRGDQGHSGSIIPVSLSLIGGYPTRGAFRGSKLGVETLMRNLAGLGLEAVLCELAQARGAYGKQTPGGNARARRSC